jgi:hypothetical protein
MARPVVNIETRRGTGSSIPSSESFTSPHSLVRIRVSATVHVVNPSKPFELTTFSRLCLNVDALPLRYLC